MTLSDTGIKNLKFTGKLTKHADGKGLYLLLFDRPKTPH